MLLIVILIILAVIVLANVRTVHQGHVQIVERLGKFHDAWGAGLHKQPFKYVQRDSNAATHGSVV